MKLSELSTDRAADVLCELTPHIHNITHDEDVKRVIGEAEPAARLNKYGIYMIVVNRVVDLIPLLLKTHRADVYGILSIMNERSVAEIAEQKLIETMRQAKELFQDDEFVDFFKLSVQQAQTEQSAPSATSPA